VSNTQWEMLLSPSTADSVQITGANTTSLDLNINIEIAKWLWSQLIQLEIGPVLRILNLEALESVWVNHFDRKPLNGMELN